MKASRLTGLLLSAVLLLSAAGCGGSGGAAMPSPSPALMPTETPAATPPEFALPRTEASLHPILSTDQINLNLAPLVWEGLFALDNTFTPQPVLCQGQSVSEDGLTWTFTLKPGVTFSDGSPLTSAEAAASLNLARQPGSRFAGRLANLRSVSDAEGAVVVSLALSNGNLPALLDVPIVKGESEEPLGTGPYVPESWGENSRLAARSGWWQNKPLPVQSIPLRTILAPDDFIYAFDTGEVSLVTTDLTGTNSLGYSGEHEVWDCPTTTMLYIGFSASPKSPCASPALRRALAFGFDRNTVAVALYARHAEATVLPVSPRSPLYDETLAASLEYSPQTMSDMLSEAGYGKGEDGFLYQGRNSLTLRFIVNTDNTFRLSAAEYLAGELTKAGIQVELRKLSWADYQKALQTGDFDLYLASTTLTADFDLSPLIRVGGDLNFGGFHSAALDGLLSAFRSASGDARKAAATALYTQLAEDAPYAPLCFINQSVLTKWGMVSGVAPTQQNPFYGIENWSIQSAG